MEIYPYLYVGENVKNPKKIIHKLKKADKKLDAYVIVLSQNPHDQLEIKEAVSLFGKYVSNPNPCIIGIGKDYEDCVGVVETIAKECFQKRKDGRLKTYLTERIS